MNINFRNIHFYFYNDTNYEERCLDIVLILYVYTYKIFKYIYLFLFSLYSFIFNNFEPFMICYFKFFEIIKP